MLGSITFINGDSWWLILLAAWILVPLAWFGWKPLGPVQGKALLPLAFRILGILLILLFLLEPNWTSERAARGANIVAVVSDNSQGLQLKESGAELSRGETMLDYLTGIESSWLADLNDAFQVRPYQFDRDLRRIPDFTQLDFQGDRSNLGLSLQSLADRFKGLPLAGVVVLSDGNATDLDERMTDLPDLPPVYPIVVGNAGQMPDVSIDRIELRQTAFDDAPVTLTAEVASRGGYRKPIEVKVRAIESDESLGSSEESDYLPDPVRMSGRSASEPQAINFRWRPLQSGIQFYEVAAEQTGNANLTEDQIDPDEVTELNNRRLFMID